MTVVDGLKANALQVRSARGPLADYEVRVSGDAVGRVRDGRLELEDETYDVVVEGDRVWLRDGVRGDRVVAIQRRAHGSSAIQVGTRRFRLMREGVLPIVWQVTEDFGGPQIVRIAKLGKTLRFRAGTDVDTVGDVELERLVLAVAAVLLDLRPVLDQAA